MFEENSCLYLFTREVLDRRGNRIGERPMLFEIAREEALDIDEEADFQAWRKDGSAWTASDERGACPRSAARS